MATEFRTVNLVINSQLSPALCIIFCIFRSTQAVPCERPLQIPLDRAQPTKMTPSISLSRTQMNMCTCSFHNSSASHISDPLRSQSSEERSLRNLRSDVIVNIFLIDSQTPHTSLSTFFSFLPTPRSPLQITELYAWIDWTILSVVPPTRDIYIQLKTMMERYC